MSCKFPILLIIGPFDIINTPVDVICISFILYFADPSLKFLVKYAFTILLNNVNLSLSLKISKYSDFELSINLTPEGTE